MSGYDICLSVCADAQNGGSTACAAASPAAARSPQAPELLLEDDEDDALTGELSRCWWSGRGVAVCGGEGRGSVGVTHVLVQCLVPLLR